MGLKLRIFEKERTQVQETATEAKVLLAELKGKVSPQVVATLEAIEERVDGLARVTESVLGLVEGAQEIVDGLKDAPEWVQSLIAAVQLDAEKGFDALGHYGTLAEKLSAIAVLVRTGSWVEVDQLFFGGPEGTRGRVRIVPPGQ